MPPRCCGGALRSTRVLLVREVVRNTLADTPSGYIGDPRAHPKEMVSYEKLTQASTAALEAMEEERLLMEREELAYKGFTTRAIQENKMIVLNPSASPSEVDTAATALEAELAAVTALLGVEVDLPLSRRRVLMLKWQQRHAKLLDPNIAFRVPTPGSSNGSGSSDGVRVAEDGTEEIVVRRKRTRVLHAGADLNADLPPGSGADANRSPAGVDHLADPQAYILQTVEAEVLDPSLLIPERVTVARADVNHVRYVLGLAYRRLSRFPEAEEANMSILRTDVRSVDAAESLLELYTGLDQGEKIQGLLEFLQGEFAAASADGRLSHFDPAKVLGLDVGEVEKEGGGGGVGGASDVGGGGGILLPEGTAPAPTPMEIALSLLSDMIIEGATRHCVTHGEGATSKYFLECLSPIAKALDRPYMTMLVEALFRSMDEHHYIARFELDEVETERNAALIYSVVTAFLKMLLVTRIPDMVDEPIQFRFFILSKLHSALRSAKRKGESYRFAEQMFTLYRANSAVYQQRAWVLTEVQKRRRLVTNDDGDGQGDSDGEYFNLMAQVHQELAVLLRQQQQAEKGEETAAGGGDGGSGGAASASSKSSTAHTTALPPRRLTLDEMDGSYRSSLFQYLNDCANDSAATGRELCVAVMDEFPEAAAPWETLALILHREDPKRNLRDAITAARRGLQLEPFNLSLILTCANFYKADHRYELYDLVMDRYRLLCHMLESAASDEDLRSVAGEILEAEGRIVETFDDSTAAAEELQFTKRKMRGGSPRLIRSVEEWTSMHAETKYPRTFDHRQPVSAPSLELGISEQAPPEMNEDFRPVNDAFGRRGHSSD